MKAIFYSLIVIILLSSSTCRRAQPGTSLEKQLIGEWKYTGKSGGYAGKYQKADPAKNQILQFKRGFSYLQKVNDQVSEQGSYELYKIHRLLATADNYSYRLAISSGSHVRVQKNLLSLWLS